MKWFNKWLAKSIKSGMADLDKENRYAECEASPGNIGYGNTPKVGRSPHSHGMQFTIYPANGGHVLEYQHYDPKVDSHSNSLHLITADQNMGEVISHAITLEMLKR